MATTPAATRAKALEPRVDAAPVNSGGNTPVPVGLTPPVGRTPPDPVARTVVKRVEVDGTTTTAVVVTFKVGTAVASLNKLEAKDEMAEESAVVGRTTIGGIVVSVVWRLIVVVVPLPGVAASVVVGSGRMVVVVVVSIAVVEVSVVTTVVVGSDAPPVPVSPGNAGRVKVVVTPSETVTTTD